jgi:acyl-CoA synthetase (AMP-forming)/AMP-acid ligase II
VSYREFDRLIDKLAARCTALGLGPGNAGAVLTEKGLSRLALMLALARIGAAPLSARAVAKTTGNLPVKAWFVDADAPEASEPGAVVINESWWRIPAPDEDIAPVAAHPGGDAICLICSSSGTTGTPKAIAISHEQMRGRLISKWLGMRAPDNLRQLTRLGLDTNYGFVAVLRVLWLGGLVALPVKPAELHIAIDVHQLNCLVFSPAQLQAALAALPADAGPFPSLQMVEIGGSALPARLASEARARLCSNIWVGYGAAEIGPGACAPASAMLRHPGGAGYPYPGVEIQAVGPDDRPLPPGTVGAIRMRSANAVDGYWGDAQTSAKYFRDGWFYPGDMGSVSAGGLVMLTGREAEIINAGGVKVSPRSIEDAVLTNPDVSEAAAFTMQDEAGLQQIWVAVVLHEGKSVDTAALSASCVKQLGAQRAPKSVLVLKQLPRNANGKVLRDQLIKQATSAKSAAQNKQRGKAPLGAKPH